MGEKAPVGRWARGLAAGILAAGLAVGGAAGAQAHAQLEQTDPGVGKTLRQAPGDVTLTFSEPMLSLGAIVQVMGPAGAVEAGEPKVAGRTVTQPLGSGVKNGSYIVSWRLSSEDGHVQSGTFTFLVADPSAPLSTKGVGTPPADQEPPSPAPSTSAAADPTPSPINQATAAAVTDHSESDDGGSLPLGWVIVGLVVLAAVIAGAVLTEVRRRRKRPAGGPRGRSTG